jgi:hypothetical protein
LKLLENDLPGSEIFGDVRGKPCRSKMKRISRKSREIG